MNVKDWLNKHICERGQATTCFINKCCGYDSSLACAKHGLAYEKQDVSKYRADIGLFNDVRVSLHNLGVVISSLMWVGVRTCGYSTSLNKIKNKES
jgi:hypothetical protein